MSTHSAPAPATKQRRPRRDKLPLEEKQARHLEASRRYYQRNKLRIQEEQRQRSRTRRAKRRAEKLQKEKGEMNLDNESKKCPTCGHSLPPADDNDNVEDEPEETAESGDDK